MRDVNIEFQEEYKSVDRFIRNAYNSAEGVSEYIRLMEESNTAGAAFVNSWKADYDRLKRSRWIRNQLAHEVSIDADICTGDDCNWLSEFHSRLVKAEDPLAALRTVLEKRAAERKAAERRELERKRALEQWRVYEAQQRAAAAKSSSNAGAQAAQSRGNLRTTVQNPAAKETNPKKARKGGAHWLWLVVLGILIKAAIFAAFVVGLRAFGVI